MDNQSVQGLLIPANEKYIEYFKEFMSDDLINKIRIKQKANTARQYAEGIMDLLLYETKIKPHLSEKEKKQYATPEKRNRTRCIKILHDYYSKDIAVKFNSIFKDGGNAGSHFSGEVSYAQLQNQRVLLLLLNVNIGNGLMMKESGNTGLTSLQHTHKGFSIVPNIVLGTR